MTEIESAEDVVSDIEDTNDPVTETDSEAEADSAIDALVAPDQS